MVLWVELCPPKKACCDSKPQAIRTLPYSKIVVTHVISWDEVTLEQGRPFFWFDWRPYKTRRDPGRRAPREDTDTPGKCHVTAEAEAARQAKPKAGSRQREQRAGEQRFYSVHRGPATPGLLTSSELLREVSVLLSHPKYWYLGQGIKPRILKVKNCVITGQSK